MERGVFAAVGGAADGVRDGTNSLGIVMRSLPRSWVMFTRLVFQWRQPRAAGASRARRRRLAGLTTAGEGLEPRALLAADPLGFDPGDALVSLVDAGGTYHSDESVAGAPAGPQACVTIASFGSTSISTLAVAGAFDVTPPVVSIGSPAAVSTFPTTNVAVMTSEAVTGLDLGDFTLTRDGSAVPLAGAQLLTGFGGFRQLSLADTASRPGVYVLRFTAADSGVVDAAGNAAVADASISWTVTAPSSFASGPRGWAAVLATQAFGTCSVSTTGDGPEGTTLVAGSFFGTVAFDPAHASSTRTSNNGAAFVAVYGPSGGLLDLVVFDEGSSVSIGSVAVDAAGGLVVAGRYQAYGDASVDLDPTAASLPVVGTGLFVARLDRATQTLSWLRRMPAADGADGSVARIAARADGGIVVAQSFTGGLTVGGEGSYAATETPVVLMAPTSDMGPVSDVGMVAFGPDGSLEWARQLGAQAHASASALVVGPTGVTVAGSFTGAVTTPGAGGSLNAETATQGFVARYRADGSLGWIVPVDGDGDPSVATDAEAVGLAIDAATGDALVAVNPSGFSTGFSTAAAGLLRLAAADGTTTMVRTFPGSDGTMVRLGPVWFDAAGAIRVGGSRVSARMFFVPGVSSSPVAFITKLGATAGEDTSRSFTAPSRPLEAVVFAADGGLVGVTRLGYGEGWRVPGADPGIVAASSGGPLVIRLADPFAADQPTADITPVATPRQAGVDSAVVTFTAAVDGVDAGDFRLWRDGASVPLPAGVEVSSPDGITWTLSGLSSATATDGMYVLALVVGGSGIQTQGTAQPLSPFNDPQVLFTVDATPPAATLAAWPYGTPVDGVDVTFSEPVSGVTAAAFLLDGQPLPASAGVSSASSDGRSWQVTGLSVAAASVGHHVLALSAAAATIVDAAGNGLAVDASVEWTNPAVDLVVTGLVVDPTAPVAGGPLTIRWTDTNVGDGDSPYAYLYDHVQVVNRTTGQTLLDTAVFNSSMPIAAGGSRSGSYTFYLPNGADGVGTLDITVTADAYGSVSETNAAGTGETNNSTTISVTSAAPSAPDLVVTGLAVAESFLQSGGGVTINWTDTNAGTAAVNYWLYDRVRVVNTTTGHVLVDQVPWQYASLPAGGGSVARSFFFTLPDGPAGAGSLAISVTADAYNFVTESNAGGTAETNNSASITTDSTLAPYPDLVVTGLRVSQPTLAPGDLVTIRWSDANTGDRATAGGWYDGVRVVNTTTGETLVNTAAYNSDAIAAGDSLAREYSFRLPEGRPGAGTLSIQITADAYSYVVESNAAGTAEANNTATIAAISTLPPVDLTVTGLAVTQTSLQAGGLVTINWTDTNAGTADLDVDYRFSLDDHVLVVNVTTGQTIIDVFSWHAPSAIPSGTGVARSYTFALPDGPAGAGSLAITVVADPYDRIAESNADGTAETNNTATITVTSALPDYPDLVVRDLGIDSQSLQASHPFTVTWNDVNVGLAAAPGGWADRVRVVNTTTGDTLADASVPAGDPLAAAGSRSNSYTFTLPDGMAGAGQIRVIVTADDYPWVTTAHGRIYELNSDGTAETNNGAVLEATSTVPDYPDLVVTGLAFDPPALQSGSPVTVRWEDVNPGRGATSTGWQDTIRVFNRTTGQQILQDAVILSAPIPAGGKATGTYSFVLPEDAAGVGAIEVTVTADGYPSFGHGSLYESNDDGTAETNNSATITGTSTLVLGPDLVVSMITAPARAFSGRDAQITWTVTNQGTADFSGVLRDAVILAPNPTAISGRYVLGEFDALLSLPVGGSVTRTQQVTLPDRLEGSWYVGVITDVTNAAREHLGENNNTSFSAAATHVQAPPTPNLVVASVTAPPTALSSDQAVVAWTVTNSGTGATNAPVWYDRVYLSADDVLDSSDVLLGRQQNPSYLAPGESYASSLAVTLPRGINGPYRFIVVADADNAVSEGVNEADNWRAAEATAVQLTPPPDLQVASVRGPAQAFSGQPIQVSWTVTNSGTGRTLETAWDDQIFLSGDDTLDGSDVSLGSVRHSGSLAAGDSYTASGRVTLPVGISGNFFLFVVTDARREVFQHVFVNNDVSQPAALGVLLTPPPDLVVSTVTAAASAEAGRSLAIGYTVTNDGATKTADWTPWTDRVYLSADRVLDASDFLLAERVHDVYLGEVPGSSYSESFNALLPATLSGTYYVIVQADAGGQVFELDRSNNVGVAAAPVAVTFQPADLVVQPGSVTAPAAAAAGGTLQMGYTVQNVGSGATVATVWRDRIVLSGDAVLGNGDDIILDTVVHTSGLAANAVYAARAVPVRIPLFVAPGNYTLFVVADVANEVFEYPAGAEANNASAGLPITISRTTADLQVAAVGVDKATVTSGDTLTVSWTVTNAGAAATNAESWFDRVVLQPVGAGSAVELGIFQHNDPLAGGGSYSASRTLVVPADIQGSYRVVVTTDYGDRVIEGAGENNNDGAPQPLAVVARPLPNLVVTDVSAPADAFAGQLITVSWTVANVGTAPATGKMFDVVYLSLDQTLDSGDLPLGYGSGDAIMSPGGHYTWTLQFRLPQGVTGGFHIIVATDAAGQIRESDETDNSRCDADPTVVTLMPPADLVVGTITVPATGVPGSTMSVAYTVRNDGANPADGSWRDSLYLSTDDTWDVQDVLLGSVDVAATVPGHGGSYTRTLDAPAPGVNPGSYRVIVRSDIRNTLPEQSETNNLAASLDSVAFDVAGLDLATTAAGTLAAGASVYYKVVVPADGQTLRFAFDSLAVGGAAQVFVRYGAMPSPNKFDAASTSPFDAHQTLTAPADRAGTYYVLVTSRSGSGGYSLRADLVPFAVTAVDSSTGGNEGAFTVKVSGSKFQQGTDFELVSAAGTEFMAVRKVVQDSVTAYVTFDMTAAAPGGYTLRAINGSTVVSLAAPFFVQASTGSDVVLGLVAPDAVRQLALVSIQVDYANRGDQDTLAPLILVESSSGNPIGLSSSSMTAAAPLQILGVSPDGPLGTLRPGSLGTASVVCDTGGDDAPGPKVEVSHVTATASGVIAADDWTMIERSVRPAGVPDATWSSFWSRIRPRLGTTWGDYVRFLNRVLDAVAEPGARNQDVQRLFARLIATRPDYLPSLTATGRLLNSTTGAPVAGLSVAAYHEVGGRQTRAASATTGADGGFRFDGLQPGSYSVAVGGGYFIDQDRNGIADYASLTFSVAADTDLAGLVVNVVPESTATVPSAVDSSALAVDPLGRTHIVYTSGGKIWQSTFDGTGWGPSSVIANEAGTSLTLRAAPNLIGGVGAGFVATWSTGSGNDAEIHWSAGRVATGGGYVWTAPARLTTNHVMDSVPTTAVLPDGRVVVVYARENAAIQDDRDLYYDVVAVDPTAFPAVVPPISVPGTSSTGTLTLFKFEADLAVAKMVVEVTGSTDLPDVSNCQFTRSGKGELKFESKISGGIAKLTGSGSASFSEMWRVNRLDQRWDLITADFSGSGSLEMEAPHGLLQLLSLIPQLKIPLTTASFALDLFKQATGVGVNPGVSLKGDVSWKSTWDGYTPALGYEWPDTTSSKFAATLSGFFSVGTDDDYLKGTLSAAFELQFMPDWKWLGASFDASFEISAWGRFKRNFTTASSDVENSAQGIDALIRSLEMPALTTQWAYDPSSAVGTANVYGANSVVANVSSDLYQDGPPSVVSTLTGSFAAWTKQRADVIGEDVVVSDFDGSRWTTPMPLVGSYGLDSGTAAAVDGAGSRLVLWTRSNHSLTPSSSSAEVDTAIGDNDVWYVVGSSGTWSDPLRLAATAGTDRNVTMTKLDDGSVVVAWTERHADGSSTLWAARWQAGGWQQPMQVTSGSNISQVVLAEQAGRPLVLWNETTGTLSDNRTTTHYAMLTDSEWSVPAAFVPREAAIQAQEAGSVVSVWFELRPIPDSCLEDKNTHEQCVKPPVPDGVLQALQSASTSSFAGYRFDPYDCEWKWQWFPKKYVVHDPNDLVAPEGFGADHWIAAAGGAIPYTIRFENAPVATAPVQTLTIRQKLDPDLKPSTFRLGSFGFNGMTFDVPTDSPFYSARLDLQAVMGCDVDVVAGIDVASGEAFWTFTAVDPSTGDKPLDPLVGFLPPDDATGHGNGFVNYTIRPRTGLPTGTRLDAGLVDGAGDYRAAIVFDKNAPMFTPAVFNTLDAAAPRSAVQSITAVPGQPGDDGQHPTFTVAWGGTDAEPDGLQGSGIASYTVSVSVDGGEFTRWLTDTSLRSADYVGEPGHTYAFFSRATDNAGNVETPPAGNASDATYTTPGGLATIGDLVWHDANGNGIQDAGETGLARVTVTLHHVADGTGADTVVGTPVITGTDGRYAFTNVPVNGQYYVVFSAPAGYALSLPNAAADDSLDSDADASTGQTAAFTVHAGDNSTWDAGLFRLGSIAGTLWNDVDGNRARTAGEPALAGWTVYIDADDNGRYDAGTDTAAVTDSLGRYAFTGLRPGNFVVSVVLQPGWVETTPGAAGSNSAGAVGLQQTYTFSGSTADLVAPGGVEVNAALSTTDCGCHRTTAGTSTAAVGIPATDTTYQPWADLIQIDAYRADPRFAGIDGRGETIVFLDTGIDVNHPFFGGDANGDGIDDRIVYQWDFADRDPDASDRAGHGSHVASVAASQDGRYVGVAPGASIIELKVFGDDGRGSFASVEQALEWVIQNAALFNVVAVNMSLGDAQNWTGPLSAYGIGDELSTLAGMNVITVAAAGNNYALAGAPGLAYPAADPNVISVGAVWDGDRGGPWSFGSLGTDYTTGADRIVSFSQRDTSTDIFAVGAVVGGANAIGGTAWLRGTSMAAPQVTGAAALAQQLAVAHLGRRLSLTELRYLLKVSGTTIVDGDDENDSVRNTGLTFRRLDVEALASAVLAYDGSLPGTSPTDPGTTTGPADPGTGTQTGRPYSFTIQLAAEEQRTGADFGVRYLPTEVADVVDVTPDPRNAGVTAIEFTFTRPIDAATLDVADLVLTGPAGAVSLAGLSITEVMPGLRYRLSGSGLAGLTAAEGSYTFTVRAAGIVSADGATVIGEASDTWTVDTSPPAAPGVFLQNDTGLPGDWLTRDAALGFFGLEADATIQYSKDAGVTWAAAFVAVEGANVVWVRQVDNAGNPSPFTLVTLALDTSRPSIMIGSDTTSLKAGETAALTFTLSEASTTFTAADVSVTGGTLTGFIHRLRHDLLRHVHGDRAVRRARLRLGRRLCVYRRRRKCQHRGQPRHGDRHRRGYG